MPIHVDYQGDGTLVHVEGGGTITGDEFLSFIRGLYVSEDRARRCRVALVDWSQVQRAVVTDEAIREAAAIQLRAARIVPRGAVVAVVAPQALIYSLSRLWEGYVEGTGWRTRVFQDRREAEQWVEREVKGGPRASLDLSVKLSPPALEAHFRREALGRDARVAKSLMLLSFLFQLLAFPTDMVLVADSGGLTAVRLVRGASAVVAVVCVFLLRRNSGVAFYDNVVTTWATLLLLGVASANAMLPLDYTAHVAWDLFLVLAVYVVLPLPLGRQVIIASIITVGDIVLFWQYKVLVWPVATVDVAAAFACANLLGIFASWEFQRWRRQEFQAIRREADIGTHLRKAWAEIQTLHGIIPICMHCKSVRSDEGFWEEVEVYVATRSGADFSHGVCPDCVAKHYPETLNG